MKINNLHNVLVVISYEMQNEHYVTMIIMAKTSNSNIMRFLITLFLEWKRSLYVTIMSASHVIILWPNK